MPEIRWIFVAVLYFLVTLLGKRLKSWASDRCVAKGRTCYCGLVRVSHVDQEPLVVYLTAKIIV